MSRLQFLRHASFGVATALLVACAAQQPQFDRNLGLETFDAAWRIVHETHFDTTFNGVDWVGLRDEMRPRAAVASSREELRDIIDDMLDRLSQSHFALIPQELADTLDPTTGNGDLDQVGDLGLDVRLLSEDVVVTKVDRTGPAWAAGVRPGWVIQRVDATSMDSLLANLREGESRIPVHFRMARLVGRRFAGQVGTPIRILLLDEADRRVTLDLIRRRDPSEPVKLGNLPTFFARMAHERIESTRNGITVGRIWFNVWMATLVKQIDAAVDAYRQLDGFVIDLRGNPGGLGAMVMGVAGHFFDDRVELGTFRTRTTTLRHVANPRRVSTTGERVQPFAGPVAVLVDGMSGSASELFAGGVQSVGRVRVFGEPTAGAVLPARMDRLPNGDVLYHAFAEFVTADGITLEGRGVIPDEPVSVTRRDLLAGDDPVLEAALAWIAAQRKPVADGS
jgi:carboxyl-terminal processing protease